MWIGVDCEVLDSWIWRIKARFDEVTNNWETAFVKGGFERFDSRWYGRLSRQTLLGSRRSWLKRAHCMQNAQIL